MTEVEISESETREGYPNNALRILIVYAADPDSGSEEGVGWGFIVSTAKKASESGDEVLVVCRPSDVEKCRTGLEKLHLQTGVSFMGVKSSLLGLSLGLVASGRLTFSLWNLKVRRELRSSLGNRKQTTLHQANWATALFPHGCPKSMLSHFLWGPIAVPRFIVTSPFRRLGDSLVRFIVQRNVSGVRHLVALNDYSFEVLSSLAGPGQSVSMEPHTFASDNTGTGVRDQNLLVSGGLLIRRKRFDLAIRSLNEVGMDPFRLWIIGDGPLRKKLKSLAQTLGVEDRVDFLGRVPHSEMAGLLSQAAILVHPARREGAGFVVAEAAAAGTPAVVFKGTGAETIVRLSDSGGKSIEGSKNLPRSIAKAILQLSKENKHTRSSRWHLERFDELLGKWWSSLE